MRNLFVAAIFAVTPLNLALAEDPAPTQDDQLAWLFVQTANSMSFDGTTLSMIGLAPATTAFSDRPHRKVVPISHEAFLSFWSDGTDNFDVDPPNAGFSTLVDGQLHTAVIELTNPKLEGNRLTYTAKVLEGDIPPLGLAASLLIDDSLVTDAITQAVTTPTAEAPAPGMSSIFQQTDADETYTTVNANSGQ
jgi:hypothetical protein